MHGEGQALALREARFQTAPTGNEMLRSYLHRARDLILPYLSASDRKQERTGTDGEVEVLSPFERACTQTGTLFRSARTYMSIEKQPCHRFQGPLGP